MIIKESECAGRAGQGRGRIHCKCYVQEATLQQLQLSRGPPHRGQGGGWCRGRGPGRGAGSGLYHP